ncbi:formyltetrahydrofolate deformylase [Geomicrobium sediminis]|uniref:Formyltetrahydrofolate deformylase n=1 Tax=Geomicrobium sediminis TaxID=1347788 RepID=A0ABS2PCF3_9BACL|nr:formyltetrahydrofolate deformylase [Geomicrobium sediminis]MBM7632740.1 formyltetrahydrofolate deformylase [Geomicrobium sediminis]
MINNIVKKQEKYKENTKNRGRILITCEDRPGIVAAVSEFLTDHEANIIDSSQYSTNPEGGKFFMRIEFECPGLQDRKAQLERDFKAIATNFQMEWKLFFVSELKRAAIFVSKELHCLRELLLEWENGDLVAEIPLVISNHSDAKEYVESFGIPFVHIPASKENRAQAEQQQLQLLDEYNIDFVVLARYMQILTPNFVSSFNQNIINIHHSFLPAFVGAKPYDRAFERGVKLIGATSHYVTNDLDEGPIIEQDIKRVNHRDQVEDLKKNGRIVERSVLVRAVKWHNEDRIIVHGNKTVVF